jgi:hypothetical protein
MSRHPFEGYVCDWPNARALAIAQCPGTGPFRELLSYDPGHKIASGHGEQTAPKAGARVRERPQAQPAQSV